MRVEGPVSLKPGSTQGKKPMQLRARGRLKQKLPTPATGKDLRIARNRPVNRNRPALLHRIFAKLFTQVLERRLYSTGIRMGRPDRRHVYIRGKCSVAALSHFSLGKAIDILTREKVIEGMLRVAGLNQHLGRGSGLTMPTGATGHLNQRREQAFRGAEVRIQQLCVRIGHHHQPHPCEIMSFGKHLGANNDIDLTRLDTGNLCSKRLTLPDGIAIDPKHSRLREGVGQGLLQSLNTATDRLQIRVAAIRTLTWNGSRQTAVMALKLPGAGTGS